MLFADVVDASAAVAATRSRLAKVDVLAAALRAAAAPEPADDRAGGKAEDTPRAAIRAVTGFLTGFPVQGRIGTGWRTLVRLERPPAASPSLTVAEVDAALTALAGTSGSGSQARRETLLSALLGRATAAEQDFLLRLLTGELRQGALEGVMLDAIARACSAEGERVRRAFMLSGSLPDTAATALLDGVEALDAFGLRIGRPVRPMLASPPRRWPRPSPNSARSGSSTSSTAPGSRSTGTATTCTCSPGLCARSRTACPNWWTWSARCRARRSFWTGRRWP